MFGAPPAICRRYLCAVAIASGKSTALTRHGDSGVLFCDIRVTRTGKRGARLEVRRRCCVQPACRVPAE